MPSCSVLLSDIEWKKGVSDLGAKRNSVPSPLLSVRFLTEPPLVMLCSPAVLAGIPVDQRGLGGGRGKELAS